MYADFKLKFNLQCLLFEHSRYVYSSVPIQPLRSHRLDPARPMSMHGPLHGCSARPNLEAALERYDRGISSGLRERRLELRVLWMEILQREVQKSSRMGRVLSLRDWLGLGPRWKSQEHVQATSEPLKTESRAYSAWWISVPFFMRVFKFCA